MPRKLFGTDGIRGTAGQFPLDPKTVHALGAAIANSALSAGPGSEVLIGSDTRESSSWLTGEIAGGIVNLGLVPRFAGVIPTAGVAYLTRRHGFAAGVMITASHNPYQDNGIKVFDRSGYKPTGEEERRVEEDALARRRTMKEAASFPLNEDPCLAKDYLDYLAATCAIRPGLRLIVDCGNGAASQIAQGLFERMGADVRAIFCSPDGRNINVGCGALHVEALRQRVIHEGADLGIAFDGDADRVIFVSRSGRIIDGDATLLVAAQHFLDRERISGGESAVVSTVISKLGLERALQARNIRMLRTPVGDKHVLREMLRVGAILGGEPSGHLVFLDYATTGDGLLTALLVMSALQSGVNLDEAAQEIEAYPQRLVNVRIRTRRPFSELPAVAQEIRAAEAVFGGGGRVLVRFSGTEPVARVMVEGPEIAPVEMHASRIACAIERELGYLT